MQIKSPTSTRQQFTELLSFPPALSATYQTHLSLLLMTPHLCDPASGMSSYLPRGWVIIYVSLGVCVCVHNCFARVWLQEWGPFAGMGLLASPLASLTPAGHRPLPGWNLNVDRGRLLALKPCVARSAQIPSISLSLSVRIRSDLGVRQVYRVCEKKENWNCRCSAPSHSGKKLQLATRFPHLVCAWQLTKIWQHRNCAKGEGAEEKKRLFYKAASCEWFMNCLRIYLWWWLIMENILKVVQQPHLFLLTWKFSKLQSMWSSFSFFHLLFSWWILTAIIRKRFSITSHPHY